MKLNKIFAAVAATAMAVSTMAVSAFAGDGVYGTTEAEPATEIGWVGLQDASDTSVWMDLAQVDMVTNDFLTTKEGKSILIFCEVVDGGYVKVAGNDFTGAWNNGREGSFDSWADCYDADLKAIKVSDGVWGPMGTLFLQGGQGIKFYGICWEDDTARIDEIKALMGGGATEEPTDEPTEEPTDEPTEEPTEEPTDKPAEDNNSGSANTGLVTVSLAGLAVAGAAVVATKKRK